MGSGVSRAVKTTQLLCFRHQGWPGREPGPPCPTFPVWKTSKGWVFGSWRKSSPAILSTTQDAVKNGNLWKKWADYTERMRRTTRHVGLFFISAFLRLLCFWFPVSGLVLPVEEPWYLNLVCSAGAPGKCVLTMQGASRVAECSCSG